MNEDITNTKKRTITQEVCPWCGGKWSVEWEPVKPICEGETNRAWFIECESCMAQGPACYTEAEARKYIPENVKVHTSATNGEGEQSN